MIPSPLHPKMGTFGGPGGLWSPPPPISIPSFPAAGFLAGTCVFAQTWSFGGPQLCCCSLQILHVSNSRRHVFILHGIPHRTQRACFLGRLSRALETPSSCYHGLPSTWLLLCCAPQSSPCLPAGPGGMCPELPEWLSIPSRLAIGRAQGPQKGSRGRSGGWVLSVYGYESVWRGQ